MNNLGILELETNAEVKSAYDYFAVLRHEERDGDPEATTNELKFSGYNEYGMLNSLASDGKSSIRLVDANIVWISFDGMKDIQSYNRPLNPKYSELYGNRSSADILEENVRWLINYKNSRNLMVGARVTITDLNIERQIEMVDYFNNLGIEYVWTNPLFQSVGKVPSYRDSAKNNSFHFDMDKYVDQYLMAYKYAKTLNLFWGSFLTVNFDGESDYHCRCCTPLEAPHLTPDGYISACDMVLNGEEPYHMEPFVVGRWNEEKEEFEWFNDKIQVLNTRKSTKMDHCNKCVLLAVLPFSFSSYAAFNIASTEVSGITFGRETGSLNLVIHSRVLCISYYCGSYSEEYY